MRAPASCPALPAPTATTTPQPTPTGTPIPDVSFPLAVVTGITNLKATIGLDELGTLASGGELVVPCGVTVDQPELTATAACVAADQIVAEIQADQTLVALLPPGLVEPATKVLSIAGEGPFGLFGPDLFGDPEARALPYPVMGSAPADGPGSPRPGLDRIRRLPDLEPDLDREPLRRSPGRPSCRHIGQGLGLALRRRHGRVRGRAVHQPEPTAPASRHFRSSSRSKPATMGSPRASAGEPTSPSPITSARFSPTRPGRRRRPDRRAWPCRRQS